MGYFLHAKWDIFCMQISSVFFSSFFNFYFHFYIRIFFAIVNSLSWGFFQLHFLLFLQCNLITFDPNSRAKPPLEEASFSSFHAWLVSDGVDRATASRNETATRHLHLQDLLTSPQRRSWEFFFFPFSLLRRRHDRELTHE